MPGNFKCPRCKELFRDNNDLKRHLERKKPCYSKDQPPESPEWSCGPCKSSFTTKGHYETHLKSQVHARMTNEAIDHMPLEEAVEGSPSQDAAGPSNRSHEPGQARAIEFVLPTLDTSKIRKTSENPTRVAVFDLIAVITGQHDATRMIYRRLIESYPEIDTICYGFKFKGRGQKFIPVTDAKGAVMIINALPGKVATRLRIEWADIIVRYLGGDLTLIQEIAHNRNIQDHTPDDHPLRFFGQDVESRVLPQSVTGIQDMRQPQVYLGYAGPPEDWTDIKRSDGTPFVPREDQLIFKFGQNDFNTSRNITHTREYGGRS